jgi:uncharacterized protein (TIGR02118 family)
MLKLIFCLRKLPSVSREEFHRYWRENHAALVSRHAKALRIRRYVQCHALDSPLNDALRASRGAPEPYDGVAEVWWDSAADLEAAIGTPEGEQAGVALLEDEQRFIDLSRSPLWLNEEKPVIQ